MLKQIQAIQHTLNLLYTMSAFSRTSSSYLYLRHWKTHQGYISVNVYILLKNKTVKAVLFKQKLSTVFYLTSIVKSLGPH